MSLKRILVLTGDLFFAPHIEATLRQLGYAPDMREAAAPGDLGDPPPALLIIELEAPDESWGPLLATARAVGVPSLGYGPHVDVDRTKRARLAGMTQVVGRSAFSSGLPALVERLAGPAH